MKHRTQGQAVERMEIETRRAMRVLEDRRAAEIVALWTKTRDDLQAIIGREYRRDFRGEAWHLAAAGGTLARIFEETSRRLDSFRQDAKAHIRAGLDEAYRNESARGAWMLDVTTPPSYSVRRPSAIMREAKAARDYKTGWGDALDTWVRTYQETLNTALRMEALHEGDADDAADEALNARIDGYDPADKFRALYSNSALQAQQDARDALVESNDDLVTEEIWMTMEDAGVCPICDAYDGQPYDEVDDEIPAHFNCRCYTRIVPTEWAKLLRSGDPAEKDAALMADARGLVPDAMVVRGDLGGLAAHFTVGFADWAAERIGDQIYGQVQ